MCFATAVTRKAKYLEEFYSVKKSGGERKIEGELTFHYANGFKHPLMWIHSTGKKRGHHSRPMGDYTSR